ncbi:MAG TPA: phage head closure protein, partial [Massilibacterium sp.]|nr:phage head closure protein [Massilibacterium sp.]
MSVYEVEHKKVFDFLSSKHRTLVIFFLYSHTIYPPLSRNKKVEGAGELRHYAELQAKQETDDGYGGAEIEWTKERNIWCHIRPVSGVQRMESMRRNSPISHEIKARFAEDVDETKRIVYQGRAYNIEAVWPVDGKR